MGCAVLETKKQGESSTICLLRGGDSRKDTGFVGTPSWSPIHPCLPVGSRKVQAKQQPNPAHEVAQLPFQGSFNPPKPSKVQPNEAPGEAPGGSVKSLKVMVFGPDQVHTP